MTYNYSTSMKEEVRKLKRKCDVFLTEKLRLAIKKIMLYKFPTSLSFVILELSSWWALSRSQSE